MEIQYTVNLLIFSANKQSPKQQQKNKQLDFYSEAVSSFRIEVQLFVCFKYFLKLCEVHKELLVFHLQ